MSGEPQQLVTEGSDGRTTPASYTTPAETDAAEREDPVFRSHSTYEKDHWETVHVDRVDQIGAFESEPFGDGPIRSRETIRVDLDGYGHGGASMHDADENVQVSFWLTPDTALELLEDLAAEVARCNAGGDDGE